MLCARNCALTLGSASTRTTSLFSLSTMALGVAAGGRLLVIDGITLHDFEFIDIGRWLEPSHTVPVTIKSLIFK